MGLRKRWIFVLALVVGASSATTRVFSAQSPPLQLFPRATAFDHSVGHSPEVEVARLRLAELDVSVLGSASGTLIDLPLFADARFIAELDRTESPGPGRLVWKGRIVGVEDSEVTFAVTDGVLAGQVVMPGAQYRLHHAADGIYAVERVDTSKLPVELPPVIPEIAEEVIGRQGPPAPSSEGSASDDGSQIDVMVLYTPASRSAAGGVSSMNSLIDLAVSNTNTAYANSGVTQRLRLVYRGEVSYTENVSDMGADLSNLQAGGVPNAHALRNAYAADFVALLTTGTDACGVGYVMRTVSTTFAPYALNVTAWNCAVNLTLAHELGHNMGLMHDLANSSFGGAYPYSYGYRDPGFFRTVMSYPCGFQNLAECPRIPYFSTPNRTYGGRVTGITNAADNVRSLNNTATTSANFRQAASTCTYSINPASISIGSAEASGTIVLTTQAGCAWTAASHAGMLTISSASSGTGSASVAFTVAANSSTSSRTGTATIAGRTFTVTQEGGFRTAVCTYSINPSSISIGSGAADGTLFVTTQAGCTWSGASNSSFITLQNAGDRTGSGGVPFSISANGSASSRSGTATIAGQTFAVSQAGVIACSFSLGPASVSLGNVGDSGTITVTTQPGCAWSAVSNSPFLRLEWAGLGRVGSSTVGFTVKTNFSNVSRSSTATIAGQTFTATQAAVPGGATLRAREKKRADFNGDGHSDLLWRERANGYIATWTLQGGHTTKNAVSFPLVVDDLDWRIVGTGDFNNDGKPDLVWHHRTLGWLYLWYMDGVNRIGHSGFSENGITGAAWKVAGIGDFNADGRPDIMWQHDTLGWLSVWLMNNTQLIGGVDLNPGQVDAEWKVAGVADFNADGKTDLLWRHSQHGAMGVWLMNGVTRTQWVPLDPAVVDDFGWQIASLIDVNGDATPDIVWHHTSGWIAVWYMNGTDRIGHGAFPYVVEAPWKIIGPK